MANFRKTKGVLSFAAAVVPLIAKSFIGGGVVGGDSWLGESGHLPGSRIDWKAEAKQTWKNSAVGACLWYLCDTLPEAPMETKRRDDKGKYKTVEKHPLTELLRRPNKHYTRTQLLQSTVLSLEIDGNAYWRIRRNVAGRIVELWYVPHWYLEPKWDNDGEFISYYEYSGGRGVDRVKPEDIVHFRMGLDPENTRKGLSRLKMVLREVVADNEATTYTVALLKNLGVPGVVISPKGNGSIGTAIAEKIKLLWQEKVTGDKRGSPIVLPGEAEVTMPGYSPEQMCLDKIRSVPEARICAATRVPAMVAQLSVGNDQRTYSNMEQARQIAYQDVIVPLQRLICEHLDLQLLPQMPGYSPEDSCWFNLSDVRAIQEDEDALYKRQSIAFNSGWVTIADCREAAGLDFDAVKDAVYKWQIEAAKAAAVAAANPDPAADPKADPEADPAVDAAAKAVRSEWARKALDRRGKAESEV